MYVLIISNSWLVSFSADVRLTMSFCQVVMDVLLFGWVLDMGSSPFLAPNTETQPLLTWRKAQETVPWNIILLLGGGFAMAKGCEVRPSRTVMFGVLIWLWKFASAGSQH